jgi:4,5-dihydroxyphthalate decarboxylase
MADKITLRTTLDDYPHTTPIKTGEIKSDFVDFEWVPVKPIAQSFKAMVREQARDVNELAIVTYLQAKVYGKPIVLLPVTMLGRFQHHTMLYNTERGVVRPADLPGRRLGMRAYTQTTGAWVRGILGREYGIDLNQAHWVTFEDAHCAEYSDPPGIERAARQGINVGHIGAFITRALGDTALPPQVARLLDNWKTGPTAQVSVERLLILRTTSPETLDFILDTPAIRRFMGARLGPMAAIIRSEDVRDLRDALGEHGIQADIAGV